VLARVRCDDRETLFESPAIAIRDLGATANLPFVIHGVQTRAIAEPSFEPVPLRRPRVTRSMRAALEPTTAGYLLTMPGLMRHLWALAVLCADTCEETGATVELDAARIALRSVFDRLSIKLRMPHYPVRPDDVLDPAAEDALDACALPASGGLGARLAAATRLIGSERDEDDAIVAYRDGLRAVLESFEDDATLIDALVVAQVDLDVRLDAVIEHETGARA
jgi:hypothetical protein